MLRRKSRSLAACRAVVVGHAFEPALIALGGARLRVRLRLEVLNRLSGSRELDPEDAEDDIMCARDVATVSDPVDGKLISGADIDVRLRDLRRLPDAVRDNEPGSEMFEYGVTALAEFVSGLPEITPKGDRLPLEGRLCASFPSSR